MMLVGKIVRSKCWPSNPVMVIAEQSNLDGSKLVLLGTGGWLELEYVLEHFTIGEGDQDVGVDTGRGNDGVRDDHE